LDWSVIETLLPQGWRELAVDMKLIKPNLPKHMNAKVTDIAEVLRLIFFRSASNSGLQTVAAAFAASGLLDISHVGLHYWEKNLGSYLSTLLGQLVGSSLAQFAPERWAGYEIILTDATCVQRPGLDQLPNRLPCTIETWIYTKLILHQLLRKLADSGSAIPPSALAESIGPRGQDAA
jgi:hypothetical protein